jgi:hypothetical protein
VGADPEALLPGGLCPACGCPFRGPGSCAHGPADVRDANLAWYLDEALARLLRRGPQSS